MQRCLGVFLLLATLLLTSFCSGQNNNIESVDALSIGDTLKSEVIDVDADLLNIRRAKNVNDEYLVLIDDVENGLVKVFGLPSLDYLYSWGSTGKGPNEFVNLNFNSISVNEDELVLFDVNLFEISHYKVTDTTLIQKKQDMFTYGKRMSLNFIHYLNDSLYLGRTPRPLIDGRVDQEFVALKTGQQKPALKFGTFPKSESDLSGVELANKYGKGTVIKPNGSRILTFYDNFNRMKIFDETGNTLKKSTINDPYISVEEDEEMIYRIVIEATSNHVYAIAFNKTEAELKRIGPKNFRPTLEVWTWKGEPVKRVALDKPVLRFTISEKHEKLYGVNPMMGSKIFRYDLSALTQ